MESEEARDAEPPPQIETLIAASPLYGRTFAQIYGRTFDVIIGRSFASLYSPPPFTARTFDVIYGRPFPTI